MKPKTELNLKAWIVVLALIIPLALVQTGGAQDGVNRFVRHFDRDQDGRVSASEFTGPREHFTRLDQNSDGYIDETECPKPGSRMAKHKNGFMQRFDTDGNGTVSKEEFTTSVAKHFERLDKNDDGNIDETEVPQGPPRGRHSR